MTEWRLIEDGVAAGSWNMAVDEALRRRVIYGTSTPCLRFFCWSPPAVSLGYHQNTCTAVDLSVCREKGISVVRRPTGGQAVLHATELTYSVTAPSRHPDLGGDLLTSYSQIGQGLAAGCRHLGLNVDIRLGQESYRHPPRSGHPYCFQALAPFEIEIDGRKLIGSAQRRDSKTLLQHGSIPLRLDRELLVQLFGHMDEGYQFIDLEEALGYLPSLDVVRSAIRAGFAECFGAMSPLALTAEEQHDAIKLQAELFGSAEWTMNPPVTGQASKIADLIR